MSQNSSTLRMPARPSLTARGRRSRRGFTLIEAMTAMTIMAIAGSTLLMGLASNSSTTRDALERAIAAGMAKQLLDEISGMMYIEPGGSAYDPMPLGPGSPEISAGARRQFDDIDDYHNIRTTPPTDRWGVTLGTDDGRQATRNASFQVPTGYFTGWKQWVDVQYVSETNFTTPLTSGTSNYRRIRVQVLVEQADGTTRTLADLSRVVTYVPSN
jgi:prepilin-type N-terminal cleavage/methylation domain-containing protein